ncbi:MAG TPA: xanthine dehydrogenase family protein molybdopterin-binding subunit [Polyangia bacterium]|jgi:xanthine dehydrogenase YagR molybdenum-binding subunit|nr:xanthine dehydrogenase family protein molybdopterin-binding subunit [Polyangia bacterium]
MARKHTIQAGYDGRLEPITVHLPDGEPEPWDAQSKLRIVGRPVPRLDAVAKVTGRAKYTQDVMLPGMLYGRFLRCPHPAARLRGIDVSRAKAYPGVKAVWTEKVGRKLHYQGQEVAAVAAISADVAEEALRLIQVDYEERPFVVDATKAMAPDAPLVFADEKLPDAEDAPPPRAKVTAKGNVRSTVETEGDLEAAFAEAEVIVEGTYRTQVQVHSALEPHGSVARWEGDELTVWSSTQATFGVREQLAAAFKLPKNKVRVLCEYMGGGFGAKFSAGPWSIVAAKLAREARAPVKMMLTRHDEQLCSGNRPDSVQWLKLGAKRDGTLVAIHLKSYGTPGVGTGAGTGGPVSALYKAKARRVEEADVFTNTRAAEAFRAPGHPQGCFALEQAMDELAQKLGMDPIELRKKNLQNPVQVAELDRGRAEVPAWKDRGGKLSPPSGAGGPRGDVRRGVGMACGVWYKFYSQATQVEIEVHKDGRVEVKNGAQDIGTGTRTYMAQIAAEELGLPLEAVTVRLGDTNLPVGPGSGGSITTPSIAPTVRAAAYQVGQKLKEVAAGLLKVPAEQVTLGEEGFRGGAKTMTWKQVCSRLPGDKLTVVASRAKDYEGLRDRMGGVQFAEVEVDTRTGVVRVVRMTVVQDFGRPLNPLTAESQINGGVIQGVSYALFEDRLLDRHTGQMVNPNLEAYKILTVNDCPEIRAVMFDVHPGFNNTGAIGLGEPPTVPTAAAIANAIADAIGARVRELPMTPDRVLAAIAGARGEKRAQATPDQDHDQRKTP